MVIYVLILIVGTLLTNTVDLAISNMVGFKTGLANFLFTIASTIPWIAVGIRRLHDADFSGWWLLLGLIPLFGTFVSVVMLVMPGTNGDNKYGAKPL